MLYTTLHNRILRLVLAVLGELIAAAALNLFIVPLSLYTGGLLGFCQLVRTLLQDFLGVSFGAYDIAGARELQTWVKRKTAPYKYPRIVEYVDALPKTVNGKIRRAAIRESDEAAKAPEGLV